MSVKPQQEDPATKAGRVVSEIFGCPADAFPGAHRDALIKAIIPAPFAIINRTIETHARSCRSLFQQMVQAKGEHAFIARDTCLMTMRALACQIMKETQEDLGAKRKAIMEGVA